MVTNIKVVILQSGWQPCFSHHYHWKASLVEKEVYLEVPGEDADRGAWWKKLPVL